MGQNLALNIESAGYQVAVYNRTPAITEEFMKERGVNRRLKPAYNLEEFVKVLELPGR